MESGASGAPAGSEHPEGRLIRRVQAGDEAAAQALFERYFPLLRTQVRRSLPAILRRKLGESDVIQEAFIAVLRRLDDFDDRGEGSFERWLRRIVDNKTTDQIRQYLGTQKRAAGRERSHADGTPGLREPAPSPAPSQIAAEAEATDALLHAIACLRPDHQTVLHLVHFKGLSLTDASRILGRSPDATRMLYGRAVADLQKHMEEE